jgi:acetyl esterase/lipase
MADAYLGTRRRDEPLASPHFADLRGMPPTLIQAGGREVLFDDAARLAEKMRRDGFAVEFEAWPGMFHVWHAFAGELPEADDAIERIGEFVRGRLAGAPAVTN